MRTVVCRAKWPEKECKSNQIYRRPRATNLFDVHFKIIRTDRALGAGRSRYHTITVRAQRPYAFPAHGVRIEASRETDLDSDAVSISEGVCVGSLESDSCEIALTSGKTYCHVNLAQKLVRVAAHVCLKVSLDRRTPNETLQNRSPASFQPVP